VIEAALGSKPQQRKQGVKLTSESVAAIVADKNDQIIWDDDMPGFGVRVRGRAKRYVAQYRVGTQQRRESLGDVRKVKIADARKAAQRLFAQVELGTDPPAERAKARIAATAATLSLATVVATYLASKVHSVRPNTHRASKRYLTEHWKPLGDRPIGQIARADVAARLQDIIKANGRSAAHAARAKLSALFAWAQREGLCDDNPTLNTNNPREGAKPRDRVLTDRELAAVWRACEVDGDGNGADFGRIIRLLILTGCRREEIGGLRWNEISGDVMTIAADRAKNGRAHRLTLPPLALATLPPRRDGRAFVFGQRANGFSGWAYQTKVLLGRIAAAEGPLAHWTLHDLRRTMRTGLGRLGVAPHVAELCINHAKGSVEAIYDHHTYQIEVADALARWTDHVAVVVSHDGGNVLPLRVA
jgi:integrase